MLQKSRVIYPHVLGVKPSIEDEKMWQSMYFNLALDKQIYQFIS